MERSTQFVLVCDFKNYNKISFHLQFENWKVCFRAYHEVARISKCFLWLYPKRNQSDIN